MRVAFSNKASGKAREAGGCIAAFSSTVWFLSLLFIPQLLLTACSSVSKPASGELFAFPEQDSGIKVVSQPLQQVTPRSAIRVVESELREFGSEYFEHESAATVDFNKAVARFAAHRGEITALVVHPTQPLAYTSGVDGKVVEHKLVAKSAAAFFLPSNITALESRVLLQSKNQILSLALSPDGKLLAAAEQGQIVVYDFASNKIEHRMTRVAGRIRAMRWDPRGELLAFGMANGGVYVWNVLRGGYAGDDSFKALEYYSGGISTIVSLDFHPSARAFFAVEREGIAKFWRLLRTEEELGLRDTIARVDQPNKGQLAETFAGMKLQFEDSWLSPDGATIMIAGGTGQVFRWKVRGLQMESGIETGQGAAFSVSGFNVAPSGKVAQYLYVTTGRSNGVRFWCLPDATPEQKKTLAPELLQQRMLFELDNIGQDASKVRVSEQTGILWISEKTGSLLTLDLRALRQNSEFNRELAACRL